MRILIRSIEGFLKSRVVWMVIERVARFLSIRQRCGPDHAEFVICDHTIDITYIPTQSGWLYLAVVLDIFSRKVVGWAMDTTMTTQLVERALTAALRTRRPQPGLLHHSDRGSQYASHDYQALLRSHHIQVSMSRTGNCYDNALAQSFFATLKVERIHHQRYASFAQARQDIYCYIEGFYNRRRRHSSLGYLSPDEFERRHTQELN